MTNPDPTHITDAMWQLWLACAVAIPGVQLGGIYAVKSGYHNTVNSNKKTWPGDYSIRLSLDLTQPDDKARAIDLTMDDAQMALRTGYLRASALDSADDRMGPVREFYGTLDGSRVYGLIKDDEDGPWRGATSDDTHLWHIHISIFTTYCDVWPALAGVADVLAGGNGENMLTPEEFNLLWANAWITQQQSSMTDPIVVPAHPSTSYPGYTAPNLQAQALRAAGDVDEAAIAAALAANQAFADAIAAGVEPGPSVEEIEDAAFRGAQRAEDQ